MKAMIVNSMNRKTMKKLAYIGVSLVLAFGVLLASASAAEEWKYLLLRATDDTKVNIDYVVYPYTQPDCYKCSTVYYAEPVWIHVKNPHLGPNDRVKIVLENFNSVPIVNHHEMREVVLTYQEPGRFSAQLDERMAVHENGFEGTFPARQEISVRVNGHWLEDPVSRSPVFRFNLFDNSQSTKNF